MSITIYKTQTAQGFYKSGNGLQLVYEKGHALFVDGDAKTVFCRVFDTDEIDAKTASINERITTVEQDLRQELVSGLNQIPQRLLVEPVVAALEDRILAALQPKLEKIQKTLETQQVEIDRLKARLGM